MKLNYLAILTLAVLTAGVAYFQLRPSVTQGVSLEMIKLFAEWRKTHGKLYASPAESNYRLTVFAEQFDFIQRSNKDYSAAVINKGESLSGPMFQMNSFGDLTTEEFAAKYTGGLTATQEEMERVDYSQDIDMITETPEIHNLGQTPFVPRIRNQGGCGSCWAFAAIVEIERTLYYRQKTYVDLSQQELVDCDTKSMGCGGGYPEYSYNYAKYYGIHTAQAYPYRSAQTACAKTMPGAIKFPEFMDTPMRQWTTSYSQVLSDKQVHAAIGLFSTGKFRYLSSTDDIFDASLSGECGQTMNHLVAQRAFGGGVALIVNSWGTTWGVGGYKRIKACAADNLLGRGARLAHPWNV